jgi:hypothetical protein
MSYTKGELASSTLEEIGIAEYEFDISVEQRQSVIRKLDSMMAEWGARGLHFSYPISKIQNSSPDDDSYLPDWAWEAVVSNLAMRIAPSYGKAISPETRQTAKHAYNTVCSMFSKPREMQFPSMPKGAGYKSTDFRFTPEPESTHLENVDEDVDISGGPA